MQRCRHEKWLDSVDVARRPIRTCSACGIRLGTCLGCRQPNVELEANGDGPDITSYHDWPPPCREICSGAKLPPLELVDPKVPKTGDRWRKRVDGRTETRTVIDRTFGWDVIYVSGRVPKSAWERGNGDHCSFLEWLRWIDGAKDLSERTKEVTADTITPAQISELFDRLGQQGRLNAYRRSIRKDCQAALADPSNRPCRESCAYAWNKLAAEGAAKDAAG